MCLLSECEMWMNSRLRDTKEQQGGSPGSRPESHQSPTHPLSPHPTFHSKIPKFKFPSNFLPSYYNGQWHIDSLADTEYFHFAAAPSIFTYFEFCIKFRCLPVFRFRTAACSSRRSVSSQSHLVRSFVPVSRLWDSRVNDELSQIS